MPERWPGAGHPTSAPSEEPTETGLRPPPAPESASGPSSAASPWPPWQDHETAAAERPPWVDGEVTTRRLHPTPDLPTRIVRPVSPPATPADDTATTAARPDAPAPEATTDAVEAGLAAGAHQAQRGSWQGETDSTTARVHAQTTASTVAALAEHVQRQAVAPWVPQRVDYRRLGRVIPVLPGSSGAGASVVAAIIADALQTRGWTVVLADTADPARSGLAYATATEGPVSPGPHPQLGIRTSWRLVARITRLQPGPGVPYAPSLTPAPNWFVPPAAPLPQVTVADVSHDAWRAAAQPLAGPGQWLRAGQPQPQPIVVVRPSRPSVLHAEQVLARLHAWSAPGAAVAPAALVVTGAKRWPKGVAGAAGTYLGPLIAHATFLPYDRDLARGGIGPEMTPRRLQTALAPLVTRLLADDSPGKDSRS